ncbi:hypothetical protein [Saccharopolyspora dendranthemae]|uniref:Uncharacterized protein n=1 Tax=Saccharopolyspora dendranthemae TaxID=1181886 RepID=A0A561V9N7_9PSEU|nr:hypothetical protein [Saccharopolyspora dendranthemae]TWG08336.1 hypothetical protein FHU35_11955 [Saccharopolyspora dendranthemae]
MPNQPGWNQHWGQGQQQPQSWQGQQQGWPGQQQQGWQGPPQQHWGPQPQPPKRKKKWPRVVLAVVGVLLVAFLTRFAFVAVEIENKKEAEDTSAPEVEQRDHEVALAQVPGTGTPGSYGGTPMFDACEFVPLDAMDNLGLTPTPEMAVLHNYFDGDVPPDRTVEEDTLAPGVCGYVFPNQSGVTIEVYQPPYSAPDRMVRAQPSPEDGPITQDRGFNVQNYYDETNNWWDVRVARPDLVVRATVEGPRDNNGARSKSGLEGKPIADALIQPMLAKAAAGPTPHRQYEFTGRYAGQKDACEVFSAPAVESVLHKPVKPQAFANYFAGDSVMNEFDQSVSYRVQTKCSRKTLTEGGMIGEGKGQAKITLSTWQDEKGASTRQTALCRDTIMGVKPVPVPLQIGDGPVCATQHGPNAILLNFKVGRATAEISVSDALPDPLQEAQRLEPLAQEVAAQLAK